MVSSSMLEKTRRVNKILQKAGERYADFGEMSDVLRKVIRANTYILDDKGKIMGHALVDGDECKLIEAHALTGGRFPEEYNQFLLRENNTRVNLQQNQNGCILKPSEKCPLAQRVVTVIPILGGRSRLGTLLLVRFGEPFDAEDLALGEIYAIVIGMEVLRARKEKNKEKERNQAVVQLAIDTLSYSEQEAMKHILKELDGYEGLLIASKIADQLEITRSVIVNALRKLESAGVIESRSLGMKGTFIRILNPYLPEQLNISGGRFR